MSNFKQSLKIIIIGLIICLLFGGTNLIYDSHKYVLKKYSLDFFENNIRAMHTKCNIKVPCTFRHSYKEIKPAYNTCVCESTGSQEQICYNTYDNARMLQEPVCKYSLNHQKLHEHTSIFSPPSIVKVTENIYVAIGYGLANCILIISNSSAIIIDTMESLETGLKVRKEFKKITNKPISHIIYTNYHPDHTKGVNAFIDDDNNIPVIISHFETINELQKIFTITNKIIHSRSIRQFGIELKKYKNSTLFTNCGIGPYLDYTINSTRSTKYPSFLLTKNKTYLKIDNIDFLFYHAPGETNDHIFIYLPQQQVLFSGDNIYQTFPNLYSIRGSYHNSLKWINSLDIMRKLIPPPKYLVPQHTLPVVGQHNIYDLLTIYRDGISYVHDQTVRYMNLGLTPDNIIILITKYMPDRLITHPYLQEYYGTIDWSVRNIFDSYLGWFSGDPVDLNPLHNSVRGNRLIELVNGNITKLLDIAQQNLNKDDRTIEDCQWSLELSSWLSSSNKIKNYNKKFMDIRIDAMQCMALYAKSANGINYYLSYALELQNDITTKKYYEKNRKKSIMEMNIEQLFISAKVKLKVEDVIKINFTTTVILKDIRRAFTIIVRDGVMELLDYKYEVYLTKITNKIINTTIPHEVNELRFENFYQNNFNEISKFGKNLILTIHLCLIPFSLNPTYNNFKYNNLKIPYAQDLVLCKKRLLSFHKYDIIKDKYIIDLPNSIRQINIISSEIYNMLLEEHIVNFFDSSNLVISSSELFWRQFVSQQTNTSITKQQIVILKGSFKMLYNFSLFWEK